MCEQFFEQLGTKISDICDPKLEVRKIMDVDKLMWILFNVDFSENNGNQNNGNGKNQNLLLKKIAPYNREHIYAVVFDIKIDKKNYRKNNGTNENSENSENSEIITKKEQIYIIYTTTRSFVNSLDNGGIYELNGLVSISLPDCLKSLFDSSYGNEKTYGNNPFVRHERNHYAPDRPCILNDMLKSVLTKEQMVVCELNEVFGPVVKVDKDWVTMK